MIIQQQGGPNHDRIALAQQCSTGVETPPNTQCLQDGAGNKDGDLLQEDED